MNREKFLKDLEFLRGHYQILANFMNEEGKERYYNEHTGKVKFIDLLIYAIKNGVYE